MSRSVAHISLLLVCVSLFACSNQRSASGNDRGRAEFTLRDKRITVEYDRPSMNGTDVLARTPEGSIWKMGDTRATILTTDTSLRFGQALVPQGSYSLRAQHGSGHNWWLIVDRDVEALQSQLEDTSAISMIPFVYTKTNQSVEQLTITLAGQGNEGHVIVQWGLHRLDATFRLQ